MSNPSVQKLSDLPIGATAVVHSLQSGLPSLTRLREFGLLPGVKVQLIRKAPLGDPMEISVRGSMLSVRRTEAEAIEVTVTEETK
jgi:ferrous iron transport protein A